MWHRTPWLGLTVVALVTGACQPGTRIPAEWKAFVMGREYGEAWVFSQLKQYEKSAQTWVKARSLALELGITDPPSQDDWLKQEGRMASELKARHGDKVPAHFLTAGSLMRAWIGLKIGSSATDVTKEIEASANHLVASGIPADIWAPLTTRIRAKPTAEDVQKLLETLESHLKAKA